MMRWFWSMIGLLAVATGALYGMRRANEAAPDGSAAAATPAMASRPAPRLSSPSTPAPEPVERPSPEPVAPPASEPEPTPVETARTAAAPETAPAIEPAPVPVAEQGDPAEPASGSKLSLDALLGVVAEAAEELPPEPAAPAQAEPASADRSASTGSPASGELPAVTDPMLEAVVASQEEARAEAEPEAPAGPAFTVAPDGAISVEGVGVIPGAGTAARPYVLDWQVLRSVARAYDPKQGRDQLPAWVAQLDGKQVRVEGNTLLPVVAATTDELLVMQNPWDGCCIGVPPTPYDAIEVKLSKMTRMGNSPTGFGQVEGTFKVDPYIVQGWLLGLYVIESGSFEAAAGMALPEL